MVKHLNSARNLKLKEKPLRVLLDSGSEKSCINKRWSTYGKLTYKFKPTTWITGEGTMETKRNVKMKFKLDEFSTTK